MSRNVLRLHRHLVNAGLFVAMLDGLVGHRQVLVNGSNAVAEVYLIPGTARVALLATKRPVSRLQRKCRREKSAFLRHLLLVDDERDVIARGHGQHLAFNADLQSFRGQQRAVVLLGALLFVEASLARV